MWPGNVDHDGRTELRPITQCDALYPAAFYKNRGDFRVESKGRTVCFRCPLKIVSRQLGICYIARRGKKHSPIKHAAGRQPKFLITHWLGRCKTFQIVDRQHLFDFFVIP